MAMGWRSLGKQLDSVGEYTSALEHHQRSLGRDAIDWDSHGVDEAALWPWIENCGPM